MKPRPADLSLESPVSLFPNQAQIIAQAIGQAFGVAYQQFLQTSGIKASDLKPGEYSDYLESQELYNGDLAHFSDSQNLRDVSRKYFFTCSPTKYIILQSFCSNTGAVFFIETIQRLYNGLY